MEEIEYSNFKEKFNEYLNEENYIAAYSNLKESGLSRRDRNELAGLMVRDIINDLEALPPKGHNEKKTFLRSMLLWIFRDYPGLAMLYKGQIRSSSPDKSLFGLLNDLSDPEKAKERVAVEMENLADNVKQGLEDTADDLKSGRTQEKVKDFIDQAEANVREGIRNIAEIFDSINKQSKKDE